MFRMLAMRPPGDPDTPVTLDLLQTITDRYTGGGVRLHYPVWLTDFRLHHRGATQIGRIFLPATPRTSTARPAPKA
ncbi:MAG TPA: hypothetical protein VFE14_03225 [Micromonosporaceae bacterium]|jgi:hypothetical protein|nr:hypothetical protein [Micromonosporaceae bacterium]